ncbi:MAG: drug/metabolite transporter (DMT)-like permease, partial [Candidatus Azotimanducaceae bacterium]
ARIANYSAAIPPFLFLFAMKMLFSLLFSLLFFIARNNSVGKPQSFSFFCLNFPVLLFCCSAVLLFCCSAVLQNLSLSK